MSAFKQPDNFCPVLGAVCVTKCASQAAGGKLWVFLELGPGNHVRYPFTGINMQEDAMLFEENKSLFWLLLFYLICTGLPENRVEWYLPQNKCHGWL